MTETDQIKYESGIRNFIKKHYPKLSVQPAGIVLISKSLNKVNSQLLKEFKEDRKSASKSNKSFQHSVQQALEKVLGNELKKPALSEAHRQLALFEMGFIEYDDDSGSKKAKLEAKPVKVAAKEKEGKIRIKGSPDLLFKTGVLKLHSCSQSPLSVQKAASEFLGSCLLNFARLVAAKATEKSSAKEELQPVDIRNATAEFFGANVLKTANSEGNKCLVLFENDLLDFKPIQTISKVKDKPKKAPEPIQGKAFKDGIRMFLTGFAGVTTLAEKSSPYLEHILLEVSTHLAANAGEACARDKLPELSDVEVKKEVEKLLPKELKQHALLQASVAVANYKSGSVKYDDGTSPKEEKGKDPSLKGKKRPKPKTSKGKRRKQSSTKAKPKPLKKEVEINFKSVLLRFVRDVFPGLSVSLPQVVAKEVGKLLESVCKRMADDCVTMMGSKGEMGLEVVKDAAWRLFPGEMAHHALSFGSNVIMLRNGGDEF